MYKAILWIMIADSFSQMRKTNHSRGKLSYSTNILSTLKSQTHSVQLWPGSHMDLSFEFAE